MFAKLFLSALKTIVEQGHNKSGPSSWGWGLQIFPWCFELYLWLLWEKTECCLTTTATGILGNFYSDFKCSSPEYCRNLASTEVTMQMLMVQAKSTVNKPTPSHLERGFPLLLYPFPSAFWTITQRTGWLSPKHPIHQTHSSSIIIIITILGMRWDTPCIAALALVPDDLLSLGSGLLCTDKLVSSF